MPTYKISLSGRSAIAVLAQLRQDTFLFLQERNLDMSDYVNDLDNEMKMPEYMKPFPPDSWWYLDEGYHHDGAEGILFNSGNDITVEDEDFNTIWESTLDEKILKNKIKNIESESESKVDDLPFGSVVFSGVVYEGSTYSYDIETEELFDPKNLSIKYSVINDTKIITSIDYEGGEIGSQDSDTTNKGTDITIEISKGKKPKPPHLFSLNKLTPWFGMDIKPLRNGFYEVKKCDEDIGSVLLKWDGRMFCKQEKENEYDKNWKIISTKIIDVEVPSHDIVGWRGFKNKL